MKKPLAAATLALVLSAHAQVPVLYEVQVDSADAAGAALNASLQAKLAAAKKVQLFSDPMRKDPPRFRLVLRTVPIDEMAQPASVWEALWLLEGKDGTNTWLNSWVGYTGVPKASEMADIIVRGVHTDIDSIAKK